MQDAISNSEDADQAACVNLLHHKVSLSPSLSFSFKVIHPQEFNLKMSLSIKED